MRTMILVLTVFLVSAASKGLAQDQPRFTKFREFEQGVVNGVTNPKANSRIGKVPANARFTAPPGGNVTKRTGKQANPVRMAVRRRTGSSLGGNSTRRTGKKAIQVPTRSRR